MFERILVSVDGSPDSEKAVDVVREEARVHGSDVVVVHGRDLAIVAPPAPTGVPPPQAVPETEDEAERVVNEALQRLHEAGVKARGQVLPMRGRLANQIVDVAEAENVDVIVLGSRGMSRLQEMVIGSVAHKIIHMARCPVLLVR
jgi:nucleotide-binding universal stress UspA family protein